MLSSVASPALPCVSTLSHRRHDFRKKKVIEHKMCVLIFSTTFVRNISYFMTNSAISYHKWTYVFMQSIRCSFNIVTKLEFSRYICEKYLNMKFHEIRLVGTELFHADGQTDRHDEDNIRCSHICESAQKLAGANSRQLHPSKPSRYTWVPGQI